MKWKKILHALIAAWLIASWTSSVEAKESVKTDIKGKIEKALITEKIVESEIEYRGIRLKVKVKWKDFQKSGDWSALMDIESVKVEPSNEETYRKLVEFYEWQGYEWEERLDIVFKIMEEDIRKNLNNTYLLDKNLEDVVYNIGFETMHNRFNRYFHESRMREFDEENKIEQLKTINICLWILVFWLILYTIYDIKKWKNKLRKEKEELKDKYLKYFKEKNDIDLDNPSVMKSVETLLPNIETLINKIQDMRKALEEQGIMGKNGWNNTEIFWLLAEWKEFIDLELKNSNNDKDTLDKLSKMHNLINEAMLLYGKLGIDLDKKWIDIKTSKEVFASIMDDIQSKWTKN